MKKTRDEMRARVAQILTAALKLAERDGYTRITRDAVAVAAGVSPALVTFHLGTMDQLRRDVMREAVRTCNLRVIAQGLVARDRHALKAPADVKTEALRALATA